LMRTLIGVQAAFCCLVLFLAGLFMTTFDRLSRQPTGFSTERLLTVDVMPVRPQTPDLWGQVMEHLRAVPGVETVALSEWALLSGGGSMGHISINGGAPSADQVLFLNISPGWMGAMKIPLLDGRDF